MDSFLGLFNPNIPDIDVEQPDYDDQFSLPPEPQVGNIEYKLKIVNPTKQRFEHLVTQVSHYVTFANVVLVNINCDR